MTFERALGWWMACVANPYPAWRASRLPGRVLLLVSYFGFGYVGGLVWMLFR